MTENWTLEDQVNDWLKNEFRINNIKNYTVESNMSAYMKEALKGSAKTKNKTSFGVPDFEIEWQNNVPVIFENKVGTNNLKSEIKSGIKLDEKSVAKYAVNGAIYYAQNMIASEKYNEVIAVGVSGYSNDSVELEVYYIFGKNTKPKKMDNYKSVNFLKTEKAFNLFLDEARLTDNEKHHILIETSQLLSKKAKDLNKLMNNLNISTGKRAVYVSGSLLAMQDILVNDVTDAGLTPEDLTGSQLSGSSDGDLIVTRIRQFLEFRNIPSQKLSLMMHSFSSMKSDIDMEKPLPLEKQVGKDLSGNASTNKQIFTFIYNNVFKAIDGTNGHLDIVGSMYSEFLKYALGDGKDIGIVLTPPYVTKLMTEIIGVDKDSQVMDLATGSAGFLISSMETMINDANNRLGRGTEDADKKIKNIKKNQLLGVELNAEMYTLAATNMILRGDGSSNIQKGDAFNLENLNLYQEFSPNKFLLNPPFSYAENGMPFIEYGMRFMKAGGMAAIIVQDSAGSGRAASTNKKILKNNTLKYSIKMPADLFEPSAGVQTSIYVFETGKKHDFDSNVRFINFRNDGYKRTARGVKEIDRPADRYQDILKIAKAGRQAKVGNDLWDLEVQVFDDQISGNGSDWNFEHHQIIDTTPTESDFLKGVGDYLAFEVNQLVNRKGSNGEI